MLKLGIYALVSIVVVWAMDGVNINIIFKKNAIVKARFFYFLLVLAMIYLISNFIYDFVYMKF